MSETPYTVADVANFVASDVFGVGNTYIVSSTVDSDDMIVLHGTYDARPAIISVSRRFEMIDIKILTDRDAVEIASFFLLAEDVTEDRIAAYMDYLLP